MRRLLVGALLAAVAAAPVFADSIDDAEAQRRGVPVAVILLEKQLDEQKRKNADLEKQIAQVQAKIDALKSGATLTAGGMLMPKADPQLPKLAEGPRESSPAYDDIVKRYMSGDWTNLAEDITKKKTELAKLSAADASDIAYIKASVAECKPAWWPRAKSGTPQTFEPTIFTWKETVNFTSGKEDTKAVVKNDKLVVLVSWPAEEMDARGPVNAGGAIDVPSGDFTQGDLRSASVWADLTLRMPTQQYGQVKVAELDNSEQRFLNTFQYLLAMAASAYYATPTGRQLTLRRCAEAFALDKKLYSPILPGREQLAALLAAEFFSHPQDYPSLKLSKVTLPETLPPRKKPEEYLMETYIDPALQAGKLTFREDCQVRQAIWDFIISNPNWTADQLKLPGGQVLDFDPEKDTQAQKQRWEWIRKASQDRAQDQPAKPAPAP